MKIIKILGLEREINKPSVVLYVFPMNQRKKLDSFTIRNQHLERLKILHIHCTGGVGSIWTLNYCAQPYCAQFFCAQIYCAQFYCAQNYCAQFF